MQCVTTTAMLRKRPVRQRRCCRKRCWVRCRRLSVRAHGNRSRAAPARQMLAVAGSSGEANALRRGELRHAIRDWYAAATKWGVAWQAETNRAGLNLPHTPSRAYQPIRLGKLMRLRPFRFPAILTARQLLSTPCRGFIALLCSASPMP
jgi:hypothetical protein